jgi:hypothetical protein
MGSSRERLKQNTLNFAEIFSAAGKNFLAFAQNFPASQKTCQLERKTHIDLVRAQQAPAKTS